MLQLYKNIKSKRIELGMTQGELAQKMGYADKSMIAKIEKGVVDLPQSKIIAFADIFGIAPGKLMGWDDATLPSYPNIHPINTQTLPMLGEIACGTPIYMNEDRESYILDGTEIDADFCLTARGDSMINARIHDGDIVFIRKQDVVENGEIAAVGIGDEATLKRFFYYKEKALVILKAENPAYEDLIYQGEEINSIHILGKAISFQSDIK